MTNDHAESRLTFVFMMMSRNVMREHTQLIMESHVEYAHIK
jgi:hypothetical protein